jgi:hypothetical protein
LKQFHFAVGTRFNDDIKRDRFGLPSSVFVSINVLRTSGRASSQRASMVATRLPKLSEVVLAKEVAIDVVSSGNSGDATFSFFPAFASSLDWRFPLPRVRSQNKRLSNASGRSASNALTTRANSYFPGGGSFFQLNAPETGATLKYCASSACGSEHKENRDAKPAGLDRGR